MSLGQVKNLTQITLELVAVCELKMNVGRRLTFSENSLARLAREQKKELSHLFINLLLLVMSSYYKLKELSSFLPSYHYHPLHFLQVVPQGGDCWVNQQFIYFITLSIIMLIIKFNNVKICKCFFCST